jgi:DEAD/DEAH box helicase domain-containing protein
LPLTDRDQELFGEETAGVREVLRDEQELHPLEGEDYWASSDFPARNVNLRTISDNTYTIVDTDKGDTVIGTVDAISALELVYPEAIYLHEGETFFVSELDLEKKIARVKRTSVDYYTQPVIDAAIDAREVRESRTLGAEDLCHRNVTVTWMTTFFKKIRFGSMDSIGYKNLDLPPQHLDTVALAWAPSDPAIAPLIREGLRPLDGLQGVRNLAITVFPILAMCDRMDVGGILNSSNTGKPTLYLYDRFPGGLGFSERAYLDFDHLIRESLDLVASCPCREGCPTCVGLPVLRPPLHQDPDLQGHPIPNKRAARLLLETVAGWTTK